MTNTNETIDSVTGEVVISKKLYERNVVLNDMLNTAKRISCHTSNGIWYNFTVSARLYSRTGRIRNNGGVIVTKDRLSDRYHISAVLYDSIVATVEVSPDSTCGCITYAWIPSKTTITVLREFSNFINGLGIVLFATNYNEHDEYTYNPDIYVGSASYEAFKSVAIKTHNYEPSSGIGTYSY